VIDNFIFLLSKLTLAWGNYLISIAERRALLELESRKEEKSVFWTKDRLLTMASIVAKE
jgi:hypothetical protein